MAEDEVFHDLAPDERAIQGALADEITGAPDAAERRIRWLVRERLVALASSTDGWNWLFRDPRDGRLWEQTYPLGSLHGPGPRRLAVVEAEEARVRFDALTV